MWLLKLPFKILALPVILLLGVFWVLGKIMTNPVCLCGRNLHAVHFSGRYLLCFPGQWGNVAFLIGVEVACLVLQYGAMMIVDISGSIKRLTGTVSSFLKGAVMDKEFIRKYCESVYPELEVTAVKCNEKYQHLKEIFKKHEDEFEKAIGDRKLFMMYEELLADYMDMEHEMAVSVYLLGAEDREKMLR